ncbi:hypothetical protein [Microbacterium sp. Leaf436]|uniref:hypothetical protein n=1 Tax=Microbacterium sp. Leaf436 TaxID=1736377 RepID=UPI0006F94840|nr:hypothetical protein [Microbacterium sp. Leaf436]KQT75400.1 hypothetical protein ASG45_02555 [Microbacterium sp. Leaf436]
MTFAYGQTVQRDRRQSIPDPYNPERTVPGPWGDAETVEIRGAWVAASSSTLSETATRDQILTEKSLFCGPTADIKPGDRIRADGVSYYVKVKPAADRNPFTGWQPYLEVPLEDREG